MQQLVQISVSAVFFLGSGGNVLLSFFYDVFHATVGVSKRKADRVGQTAKNRQTEQTKTHRLKTDRQKTDR